MSRSVATETQPAALSSTLLMWAGVVTVEGVLLVGYFTVTNATVEQLRYLVYPFVWINAGLWTVSRTNPTPRSRRHRTVGLLVAGAYLLVVLAAGGKVGLGTPGTPLDVRVAWYAPGWGPLVGLNSSWVRLYLVPFEVVGYAALAYAVYANTVVIARGTVSGVLGLATCVGCSVPILAPAIGLLGGPATALTTTAYRWSYDLGTLLYLLTLGLLYVSYRRSA